MDLREISFHPLDLGLRERRPVTALSVETAHLISIFQQKIYYSCTSESCPPCDKDPHAFTRD